jgi:hypothetical protein
VNIAYGTISTFQDL